MTVHSLKRLLAVAALLCSLPAFAGSVSFRLSLTGSQLTVTNQGDSAAFYPAVFRLQNDGNWGRLDSGGGLAELASGAQAQFTWPDIRPLAQLTALEHMQPVMVRFFDQAGVGFGQISFFRAPPAAKTTLKARYADGALQIEPPAPATSLRATWVLWPQEEGINPIRLPVRFEHRVPPAQRIDWQRQGKVPFTLDTGAGQPAVILIHETEQGYGMQLLPGGGLQGREQRAAWLDATPKFYYAALIALAIAVAAMVMQFLRRPGRTDPGAKTGQLRKGRAKA